MRREADAVATLVVFPGGNHVCENIPYKVRPLTADWMARQLRRRLHGVRCGRRSARDCYRASRYF